MHVFEVPVLNRQGDRVATALVDAADAELVSQYTWHLEKGCYPAYFDAASSRSWRMHKLLMPGVPNVDHVDGDGLNNRRKNLRPATHAQNMQNRKVSKHNRSGFKGVYWHKGDGTWHAQIQANGQRHRLGSFKTPEDAAVAYNRAALNLHGEFARLNELSG